MREKFLFCLISILSITVAQSSFGQLRLQFADSIIFNAHILQQDETYVSAIAIKDQKIIAIGSYSSLKSFVGSRTKKINARGKLIIPGLIDSHIHAIRAGLSYQSEASWRGIKTIPDALDYIRTAAKAKPKGTWIIIAGGWVPEQFKEGHLPTKEQLLSAAPDHYLYIQKLYSSVFISPGGIEALGVMSNSELLSRLEVVQDKSGNPTGWLNGNARTISDLFEFLPQTTFEEKYLSSKLFFRKLNQLGLTGVIDPGGYNFPIESYAILWKLHHDKELPIRISYSFSAPKRDSELEDFKKIIQSRPENDALLHWNGIGENVTWGMYNNESPTEEDQRQLQEVLQWAAAKKITATFHWNNNESINRLLDVIEQVQATYSTADLRWSIAHLNNIDDKTLLRMKKLSLGWLVQDALYFQSRGFEEKYGLDALKSSPRIRQAMTMGLPVGAGTDAHRVMDFNPFIAIEWLISGRSIDGRLGRESSQLLTRFEAVSLYTNGSARFLPDHPLRGDLAVGKYADLAILDQNIFTIPIDEINRTQSELTMVGGKIVFASGNFQFLEEK
ncbi:MAG: amidohydrolase [Betaproteobacteria bacterium]|jgi:predicted amidohydrolase YtcJ